MPQEMKHEPDVKREIAELRTMLASQLRQKHLELLGEPSRTGHREYLFRRLAWKLQALAEGDLSERARRRAAELASHADLRTSAPRPIAQAIPVSRPAKPVSIGQLLALQRCDSFHEAEAARQARRRPGGPTRTPIAPRR